MALSVKDLISLGKAVANAEPSAKTAFSFDGKDYSYNDLESTFREELNQLAGSYALYRTNKNTIFQIMEEVINTALPKRVIEAYGDFAEIKTFKQGDKPSFRIKITAQSRRRAKKFVTKVGLAGVYEVFKLDGMTLEVPTTAYGGAAQIAIEEFLDQTITMADLLDIVMEGLDDSVYEEIAKALTGAISSLPQTNIVNTNVFDETQMDELLVIADSYGVSSLYCTYEFASTIVPDSGWRSDAHKDERWAKGYIADYKGHKVIVLPQSFTDETNTQKVFDPSYCYIIPGGANKPVKIAFEGDAVVDDVKNDDWSREIKVYKKFGVAAMMENNICVYHNSNIQ